jgi:hypothetical protein
VLAAFLGQVGWPEEEALTLWKTAAESSLDNDGERLFHKWFRKMLCPGCRTIRSRSRGYPQLGLGGLGYCKPDLRCGLYDSPVGKAAYLTNDAMAEDRDHLVSLEEVMLVRLYDWHTGREGGVEISLEEKAMLEALLKDNPSRRLRYSQIRIRGRLRPMFSASKDDEISGRLLSEML